MRKLFIKYWPIGIIVGLWVIFSAPFFFKGLVPFPSTYLTTFFSPWSASYGMPVKNNAMPDVITQIYPWKKLTIDVWRSGKIPLWNPFSFSGTAHAGNYQSAVFSPFNVLFFILPFLDAWSILVLLQPLLAGLFMYLFVRSLDRSTAASTIAAVAFMFCGFMVTWMAYGTLGYAVLWLPFILWGIHTRQGVAISAGIALSLVSGHFQMSLYVIAASAFYIFWKKFWVLYIPFIAGIFFATPQLLLSFHAFSNSVRNSGVVRGEIIPWSYLVTFIAPDFFGNPVTRNDWFGHYAEWAGFVGVVPFLLAFYASIRKKTPEILFFIVLAIISLLFALPTPFNDVLYLLKVPVLSGSAASRIIILASFAFAVLSAYGLDGLISDWKEKRVRKFLLFIFCCWTILALIWLLLFAGKIMPPDKLSIAKHNFVVPGLLVIAASLIIISRKKIGIYILVILTAFDLLRFAAKWMPFDPRQYVYPKVQSLTYLQQRIGNNRVLGNIGNEVGSTFGLQLVDGYDAVYQARYGEFMNAVSRGYVAQGQRSVVQFDRNGLYKTDALQLLGIRYVYHRQSDGRNSWVFPYWEYPSMRQVYSDESYSIFEYPDAFPRAFLASSYVVTANDKDSIHALFAKDLNRRDSLVLEEKPDVEPQLGTGSAQIISYKSNSVSIKTTSGVSKLLFLSDVFDSGWKATLDGKNIKIYRADYDFRAVYVPAGVHTVIFYYDPPEFKWGLVLTAIGIGMIVLYMRQKNT